MVSEIVLRDRPTIMTSLYWIFLSCSEPPYEDTDARPGAEPPAQQAHEPIYEGRCAGASLDLEEATFVAAWSREVDPVLLASIVAVESSCDPTALGSSGEIGLTQVHPKVWTETLKVEGIIRDESDLWDVRVNLDAAAYILRRLGARSEPSPTRVISRYNGSGPKARAYGKKVRALMRVR